MPVSPDLERLRPRLLERLSLELETLPVQQMAAVRVLQIVSDPDSSARNVADAAAGDPSLTARIIRLANSAYYGLSGRVGNARFAVTVIGFSAVRALAAVAASGLADDDAGVPDGFWEHATTVSVAATIVAPRVAADSADAFCLGLLHDLGAALLHRVDPAVAEAVSAGGEGPDSQLMEREVFGLDHAEAGAVALETWHFPRSFTEALRDHHIPAGRSGPPLLRALQAGEALADLALDRAGPQTAPALVAAGLSQDVADGLIVRVREQAAQLQLVVPGTGV